MATPEIGYNREQIKSRMQELHQQISRIEAGEKNTGADLAELHLEYEKLQSQLEDSPLDQAA